MSGAAQLRRLLGDGHACVSLAKVARHEGEADFWAVNDDGDLEISVLTHQHEVPVQALLGALVGGAGKGVWAIPSEGTEVVIAHAEGGFEGDAVIVAVLPTGQVPVGLAPDRVVVVGAEVHVLSDDVQLGAAGLDAAASGVVVGGGVDPFTGATYAELNSTSSVVKARKA
jgi:hypothetical protein